AEPWRDALPLLGIGGGDSAARGGPSDRARKCAASVSGSALRQPGGVAQGRAHIRARLIFFGGIPIYTPWDNRLPRRRHVGPPDGNSAVRWVSTQRSARLWKGAPDQMSRLSLFNNPLLLGFDHFERVLDRVSKASAEGYPPYNIEQLEENRLRI